MIRYILLCCSCYNFVPDRDGFENFKFSLYYNFVPTRDGSKTLLSKFSREKVAHDFLRLRLCGMKVVIDEDIIELAGCELHL